MKESKRLRRMQGGRICAKGEVWTQTKILSPNIFCKNSLMLRSSVTFKPTCSNCFEITLITIVFDSRVQYSWLISFIVALVTFEKLFWIMSSHVHFQICDVRCWKDAVVAFVEVRSNIFPGHFIVLITEIVILIELWHIVLWSKLVRLWSITYFSSKYESDQTATPPLAPQ